ncbi:transcriptional regulator with an ATP-binding domain [Psychroflexus torquis ATCC 700755]|uniref:Transcriptional regulator with an ATP-binding domain n=1 Tax=Psychroflexus torquis (strain ATCC 700755 / CIP 106069 / ACAM 623) TaxID=313595 RepID=K4IDC9_PSYTT|nr:ATP-binding protein [Psychroflexus torquis]AFU67878.1 transcriptional regulator with an ATP-binding domain [Psychroflexus torquis ATCC 700755]
MKENSLLDKKSLSIVTGSKSSLKELAKDCVCFANAQGGSIIIGIEDDSDMPPDGQVINDDLIEKINKSIPALTLNVGIMPLVKTADNGAQFIELQVFRTTQSVASTTDGRYYMRISDDCKPIPPEDLARLFSERNSFVWEEKVVKKILSSHCDAVKYLEFLKDIKESERISDFVKQMNPQEMMDYYFISKDGFLTNLGILWIGKRTDRATLHYPPSVQFIKYDEQENKVSKKLWDDHMLNPKELINSILKEIPDWNEFVEVSDGIFRKNVHNYEPEIIREIVANAFAHRNYTMRGDIFINLFHDRLEIHSPGLLPLGVTPENILTKSVQRNSLLAKLFYDLRLMEKEGSGYDKVYELLLGSGKQLPTVIEADDRVTVILKKQIVSKDVLKLMDKASQDLQLKQKEVIALGIVAQSQGISTLELSKILNISKPNGLQYWIGRLIDLDVVLTKGKTKGTFYYINPDFIRYTDFIEQTNLKRIEPHRLQELIYEDLKNYPESSISDINKRIGVEIKPRTLKDKIDDMVVGELVKKDGEKRWTIYSINIKG